MSTTPLRRVLVLLLDRVHLLDLAGPVQALYEANGFGANYELHHVAQTPKIVTGQGLTLSDLAPLPTPHATDLVLIPGMESSTLHKLEVPGRWLREAHAAGATLASICSGAFALARAGLLDGRQCTTHWKLTERLQKEFPAARVHENRLYVEDSRVLTSAGVAAGIDLALALLEAEHGPLMVAKVAREMVVYLRRSGDHGQESIYLDHRTHLHPGVHRVQDWLVQHPEEKPTLERLGRLAAMSPRNLTRVFQKATGITPKRFAAQVKLQVAKDLSQNPELTVDEIASRCGFADARQLRRLWKQSFGSTLSSMRRGAA